MSYLIFYDIVYPYIHLYSLILLRNKRKHLLWPIYSYKNTVTVFVWSIIFATMQTSMLYAHSIKGRCTIMTNTPNRYTLILLKDYANLSQIKVSPFIFWLMVTLFISAFLFCFIAIVVSGFIWQNSNAIKLERDALYKQFVAAQVRINRLTALEDIVYKKNIAIAKVNKRADVEGKHIALTTHATQNANQVNTPVQESKQEENISHVEPTNTATQVNTPPQQAQVQNPSDAVVPVKEKVQSASIPQRVVEKEIERKPTGTKTERKPISSKAIALKNVKTRLQQKYIVLDMDIINTSKAKQDGSIEYTVLTTNGDYKVSPNNYKKNAFYTINRRKDVKANLALPKGVTRQMVTGLKIELLNENVPIVRIIEEL